MESPSKIHLSIDTSPAEVGTATPKVDDAHEKSMRDKVCATGKTTEVKHTPLFTDDDRDRIFHGVSDVSRTCS